MVSRRIRAVVGVLTAAIIVASFYVRAQTVPAPAVATATPPAASSPAPTPEAETPPAIAPAGEAPSAPPPPASPPVLRAEQLDQLLAPIALYPDALLAQILMGATYPLEVVYSDRWVKANPDLKGQMLED